MRYFVGLFLTFLSLSNMDAAGFHTTQEKLKCVVVPADQALLAVASQPDSPLVFEDAKILSCLGAHAIKTYKLRNRGVKPIRSFTIAGWSSGGGGFNWGWGGRTPEEVIMPGDQAPMEEREIQIVPLTKEIREELKLVGPMQGAIILMVVTVEYTDGTKYSAENASKALESYFEKMGS